VAKLRGEEGGSELRSQVPGCGQVKGRRSDWAVAKLRGEEGGPELGFQVLGCGKVKERRGWLRARFSGARLWPS